MYLPPQYAEPRVEELHRIVREHPLGLLVTNSAGVLDANHIPFLLDADAGDHGVLVAHVARANPVWREVRDGDAVLVVFRGVDGYISPNWYPGKQETHRRVPTWNYAVVHAHGTIHVCDDEAFVRGVVARLTRRHEAGQPQPWKMGDAPADYLAEMLQHIVGLEIRVSRLEGKRKLNQHHQAPDLEGAIRGLEAGGNAGLAEAMRSAVPPG
jgi:transcriptional regulator